MHRTYLKLLVVFAIGAGCRDTEHAGETGLLSFRFALTGCTSVAAGGRALAQGATVELVVSQNNSPPAGDLTVTSGSTEAISLAPASTGFFAAAATVTPACTGKSGSCETREAHVFMLANAVGTSRLAVSRSGIDLDALKVPVQAATGVRLKEKQSGATSKASVKVSSSIGLVCTPVNGSTELIASTPYVWSVSGSAAGFPTPLPSTSEMNVEGLTAGTASVTCGFGSFTDTMTITVTP